MSPGQEFGLFSGRIVHWRGRRTDVERGLGVQREFEHRSRPPWGVLAAPGPAVRDELLRLRVTAVSIPGAVVEAC